MIVHSQTTTAVSMGLDHGDSGSREMVLLPGSNFGELQRWGSVTSTASSSDWNDIGLPPLPRQRSISAPVWANLERQGSGAAAAAAAAATTQHYQHTLAMTGSGPLPQEYLMQQADLPDSLSMSQPLQPMGSDPMDTLVQDVVYRHSSSPRSCAHADVETVYEDDSTQAWECLSPAAYAAAAAAHGRSRRTHQVLHSSASMSSTTSTSSGSSFSQPLSYAFSGRSSGAHSHSSISPMAVDSCNGNDRARSLPCLDRHSLPRHSEPGQQHARLNPQELAMLAKLKTILSEKEQLNQVEKHLRHKLGEEASRAMSGSPRAAAQAAALKAALLHQQQRSSSTGSSFSSHRSSPLPHQALPHSPARHAAGSPPRRGNSTAAALLAANADPAVVAEYLRAHKLQQQQHQACMAAAAAAAAAGSSPHGGHHVRQQAAKRTAMSPAAMAKLKQLMALQQQQIQIQQELLSLLPPM